MFTIRSAGQEDYAAWLDMRHALWPKESPESLRAELDEILALTTSPAWLAFAQNGQPIGLIEMALREEAPGSENEPVPYIEGWYVVPEWRRRGVGGALVRFAEEWARSLGFRAMASDTTPDYPLSPAAHAALGYRLAQTTYHFIKRFERT